MGLPGAMKCQVMPFSCAQASMAFDVNSVPLSETIIPGLPRWYQRRQFARHPPSRDRRVGDRRQTFPGHVIDDVQDAEPAAAGELVVHKIKRPAGIWLG